MFDEIANEKAGSQHIYRIGVFIDNSESFFNKRIINDLIDLAEEKNLQLVFFFGGALDNGLHTGPGSLCYSLPTNDYIHALLVFPNCISPYNPISGMKKLLEKIPGIPVYSFFATLPSHFSVVVNESSAIDQLITHLVKVHSFKKFALLTGPRSSDSISHLRQCLIEEALQKHTLDIPPDNLFSGSFSLDDGKKTAKAILSSKEKTPDVLICLNDQMAIGAINEFINNGLSVPEDIAVVGFDDVEENAALHCALTTINYPIWTMCRVIIEKIANDLFQRTPYTKEVVVFDAEFVNRSSCGCIDWFDTTKKRRTPFEPLSEKRMSHSVLAQSAIYKHSIQEVLAKSLALNDFSSFSAFIINTINTLSKSGQLTTNFIEDLASEWTVALAQHSQIHEQTSINTLFIDAFKCLLIEKTTAFTNVQKLNNGSLRFFRECNELLTQKMTVHDSLVGIGEHLPLLDINQLAIIIIAPDRRDIGEIRLIYEEGVRTDIPEKDFPRVSLYKYFSSYLNSVSYPIALLPVSRKSTVFGYICVILKDKQISQLALIQEMISLLISAAADNLLISDHIEALIQKNQLLSKLSLIDEFTGLYNRRALYHTGRAMYEQAQDKRESSCFIFIDMDGLKQINDSCGHKAGDTAIKTLADILQHSFRDNDLVVRYGGDEFVIVMTNITEIVLEKTLARIANRIAAFNIKEQYKWIISVSWGVVFLKETTYQKSFESIIEESDINLYKEKHKKKNLFGFSKLS